MEVRVETLHMTDVKRKKKYSGDDHSSHPWQGPVLKETSEESSESLARLLYQVFSHPFKWYIMSPNVAVLDAPDICLYITHVVHDPV